MLCLRRALAGIQIFVGGLWRFEVLHRHYQPRDKPSGLVDSHRPGCFGEFEHDLSIVFVNGHNHFHVSSLILPLLQSNGRFVLAHAGGNA